MRNLRFFASLRMTEKYVTLSEALGLIVWIGGFRRPAENNIF